MSDDDRPVVPHPMHGEVLPSQTGIERDIPLARARSPLRGVAFQRIYLEITTRAWEAFNDLANEYRRTYQVHAELIRSKENYERALHRFRHLPSILHTDTQILAHEMQASLLRIQAEAQEARQRMEERRADHEIAMAKKRRELAAIVGDEKADEQFRQIRRETGLNEAKFKKAMSEAEVLEAQAVLDDIRENARNMASALAAGGSPLAKSPQEIFETAIVSGRDSFVAEFVRSRGGYDNLSADDRKLIENIDALTNWIRFNKADDDDSAAPEISGT